MPIGTPSLLGTIDGSTTGAPPENIAFTFPSTVAVGTVLLVAINNITTATISAAVDSRGNTYSLTDGSLKKSGSNVAAQIVSGVVSTEIQASDTLTLTFTSFDFVYGKVFTVDGLATSSPFDVKASAEQAFAVNYNSGSTATTAQADELLFGVNATDDETATFLAAGSFTELTDNAGPSTSCRLQTQYQIVAATGTYASTATCSTNADGVALIATYKGGAAAADTGLVWVRA